MFSRTLFCVTMSSVDDSDRIEDENDEADSDDDWSDVERRIREE